MKLPTLRRLAGFASVLLVLSMVQVAPIASATAQELRVLSAEDTQRIAAVGNPRISPDDQWVLYTNGARDMEDDELKRTTHIWRVGIDGSNRRQLTHGEHSATSPEWFPDGERFAFLSSRGGGEGEEGGGDQGGGDRGGANQVFVMYFDGGEAWQATEHEGGVSQFRISPDGTRLVFTARDPLSDEDEQKKKMKDDAEVVDENFRMTHLWAYDIASGAGKRLTEGEFTVSDPQWSPDSTQIAYVTRPNPKVDDASYSDIHVVDVDSGGSRMLYENAGPDTSPRWSPDGSTVAFASNPHADRTVWYSKLYLIPAEGGEPRILLDDFDLAFNGPIWSRDGESIFWSTGQGTTISLFEVDIDSEEIDTRRPASGASFQWQLSNDGDSWVWVHSNPSSPSEIYVAPASLENPVQLTDSNPWLREEAVQLGDVSTIRWKNGDDEWIEGVLTKPVGYVDGQRYPFILNPHGGPSGAVIESFNSSNHFFAGNGFMVLQPNFRGSSNYGQKFLNANRDNWGIRDYDDCMTGVDYVIAEGMADPDRMVAYGWSYGGYMTFWISTQTDRFKVISPGAGLSNLYSMYSTTDIPSYLKWFFGTPWDNEDIFRQLSPIRHAKNVTAKILIMHGANDARVPPEQAVEFYKALKDLGKDVTFVRYPRQGHGIAEPRLAMDRLRRYLYTFSEAVGVTPVSEKAWEEEKKKAHEKKTTEKESGSIIDVEVPPSDPDPGIEDLGIFEVIERKAR